MMRITPVVKQLLLLNIIFFVGSQIPSTHAYPLFSEFVKEEQFKELYEYSTLEQHNVSVIDHTN